MDCDPFFFSSSYPLFYPQLHSLSLPRKLLSCFLHQQCNTTMQQDTLHLLCNSKLSSYHLPPPPRDSPVFPSLSRPRTLHICSLSSKAATTTTTTTTSTVFLPQKPSSAETPKLPLPPPENAHTTSNEFEEKMLFLDSIGIDFFSLIADYPPIITVPFSALKSTLDFLLSMEFNAIELRRIIGMCPEILSRKPADLLPIFTFLLREARVHGANLRRVINSRPRLLACSVESRLRPTLYFLQSIGITQVSKHTNLLSCSVEDKFMPRIEYLKKMGFSHRDALSMFRKFPQLFCYSIKENLEPKFNYFVVEMGRDLKELKEFPHYFSFSLENRIKPRHQSCVDKGVCFPLPILLKTSDQQFHSRLEVCCNASIPIPSSPLWCTDCTIDSSSK